MKRFYLTLLITLIGVASIFAQAPQTFKYQAVVRDSLGNIIVNQLVSIRIGIIQDSINGTLVYSETQSSTTNQFGMIVLEIGSGTVETGIFKNMCWGSAPHFLKLELDEAGGTNYQFMGTSQLLSVPYSLNSGSLTLISPNGMSYDVTVDDNGNLSTIHAILCPSTVTDSDSNTYNVVRIGAQCWMAENLTTTKYNDGTGIPLVTGNTAWGNLTTPGYCWYNNDSVIGNTYGAMYNWHTVNTGNLCPTGWHVPTKDEWTTLTTFLVYDSISGGKLKETGTAHWTYPNTGATNETGFTALPGGHRSLNAFTFLGNYGYWWSATEATIITDNAWYLFLIYASSAVHDSEYKKKYGFSVRCLMN